MNRTQDIIDFLNQEPAVPGLPLWYYIVGLITMLYCIFRWVRGLTRAIRHTMRGEEGGLSAWVILLYILAWIPILSCVLLAPLVIVGWIWGSQLRDDLFPRTKSTPERNPLRDPARG